MSNEFSRTDKFIVFVSSFVAITALLVSIWQGIEMREHNRLSVKPLINFTRNYSDRYDIVKNDSIQTNQFQLILSNNGTGPAIIKSFELYYKDKLVSIEKGELLWAEFVKIIPEDLNIKQAASYNKDDVVLNGINKSLIRCDIVKNYLQDTKLIIRYESIYEEEFVKEINLME